MSLPYGKVSQAKHLKGLTRSMWDSLNASAFEGINKKHLWVFPDQNEHTLPVTIPDFD